MRHIPETVYKELMRYLFSRPYQEVANAIPALIQLPELPENETSSTPQETVPPSDES